MKKTLLTLQVFISFIVVSCSTSNDLVRNSGNVNFVHADSFAAYSSMFEDFQLIPLENNRSCMLSKAQKIQIFGEDIYIMDKGSVEAVHIFGEDGGYKGKVGNKGHAKNEYTWLFDFTTKGDSMVCLLDVGNVVKLYNSEGAFVSAKKLDTENYYWTMDYSKGKYILSSLHNGSTSLNSRNHLLYFFDENLHLLEEKILIPAKPMKESPLHHDPSLCMLGDSCIFLDIFQNKFFVFNLNDLSYQDEYDIKTSAPYTYEDMVNGDMFKTSHDKILSVFSDGNKIFGWMHYGRNYSYYELNIDTKEAKVCPFIDFISIEAMTYKNGYIYAVVQPNSLKNMQEAYEKALPTFSPELCNKINQHKDRLDSKNNFFVLKMKPKQKMSYCKLN